MNNTPIDVKKAERQKARKARTDAKKAALQLLVKAVEKTGDDAVKQALATLTATQGRASGDNKAVKFVAYLQAHNNTVTLRDLFNEFQVGKGEAKKLVRQAVKHAPSSDARAWVIIDGDKYTLVHTGENPPKGYTGFIPDNLKAE